MVLIVRVLHKSEFEDLLVVHFHLGLSGPGVNRKGEFLAQVREALGGLLP